MSLVNTRRSSSNFRIRQLSSFKPLFIFYEENGQTFDEEAGPKGEKDEQEKEEEKHNSYSQANIRKKIDIPVPIIGNVDTYEVEHLYTYTAPSHYVRFKRDTTQDFEENCEYEATEEDVRWLEANPDYSSGPNPLLNLDMLQGMIDRLEKLTPVYGGDAPSNSELEDVFRNTLNFDNNRNTRVIADVKAYWKQRRDKYRKPLLFRFWPQTNIIDTNPHRVFRPREKERYKLRKHRKNDQEAYSRLKQLREDFISAQSEIFQVIEREKAKRTMLNMMNEIFEQAIWDMTQKDGQLRIKGGVQREKIKLKLKISRPIIIHPIKGEEGGFTPSNYDVNPSYVQPQQQQPQQQYHQPKIKVRRERKEKKDKVGKKRHLESEQSQDPMMGDDDGESVQPRVHKTLRRKSEASPWGSPDPSLLFNSHSMHPLFLGGHDDVIVPSFTHPANDEGFYSSHSYIEDDDVFSSYSDIKGGSPRSIVFRGRIGRGGRLVIDRLERSKPIKKSFEIYSVPPLLSSHISNNLKPSDGVSCIVNNKTLASIYEMSDSDTEESVSIKPNFYGEGIDEGEIARFVNEENSKGKLKVKLTYTL